MGTAANVLAALQGQNIKKEGEGRYRLNSPLRPGSNSHAFTLMITDEEHGAWKDHASGTEESGSLYDLAKRLGIEIPRASVASTKRAYTGLKDYAEAHGLTADDMSNEPWLWREKKNPKHKSRPALEFPTRKGTRWRFIDGEEPRYISEYGYEPCWYGLSKDIIESVDSDLPIVLCNGEVSTISGQTHGIPSVCMTSGEKAAIPPGLLAEFKKLISRDVSVVIALDCDKKGRESALGLLAQLHKEGYSARAIDLGLTDGGDLADFCKLYGTESAKRLYECKEIDPSGSTAPAAASVAKPMRDYGVPEGKRLGSGKNWVIVNSNDLDYVPPVRWLHKPYIVDDDTNVIYGPPGSGKSFFAVWLALQIAQTGPCLYVAYEGEHGYNARIRACRNHYGYKRELLFSLGGPRVMDDIDFENFIEAAGKLNPVCIFIDTLARSLGGDLDENSARDMGKYFDRIDEMRHRLKCAIVLVHHSGKSGAYRGSSSILGTVGSMTEISPNDEFIEVSTTKSKDSGDNEVKLYKLQDAATGKFNEDGTQAYAPVLIESNGKADIIASMTKNQRKILEVMGLDMNKHGTRYTDIQQVLTNLSGRSLTFALSSLIKRGFVDQEDKGSPYVITDTGKEALEAGKPWQAPEEPTPPPAQPQPHKKSGLLPGIPEQSAYHKAGM